MTIKINLTTPAAPPGSGGGCAARREETEETKEQPNDSKGDLLQADYFFYSFYTLGC
ncbi:MAG: hypothetical protein ACLFT6_09290 [Bacteroidales bacterium]